MSNFFAAPDDFEPEVPVKSAAVVTPPAGFAATSGGFTSNKKFPFSETFQTKALAVVLRIPSMLQDYVNDIRAGYFGNVEHQNLFRLIQTYYQTYKCAPTEVAIMEMIKDDCQRLGHPDDFKVRMSTLAHEVTTIDISEGRYLEDRVKSFVKFQRAVEITTKMADLCESIEAEGDSDFDAVVPLIRELNAIGTKGGLGFDFYENIESLPDRLRQSENYSTGAKIPIGWSPVDQALDGGMSAGEIGFLVAGAGVGKSTGLVQAATSCSMAGFNAIVYTMELKEEDYALREMQRLLGLGKKHVLYESQRYRARLPYLIQAREEGRLGKIHYKYYPPGRATVDTLRSHFSNLLTTHGNGKPWLIIVDYVEKLKMGDDRRGNREDWALIGDAVNELIAMGHEFGSPVLSASQTNRAGYAKVARSKGRAHTDKDDIGASWKKVEHADLVLAFDQSELEKAAGLARIRTMKIRRGQDGLTFRVKDERPIMRLTEINFEGQEVNSYAPRSNGDDLHLTLANWDQRMPFDDESEDEGGHLLPPAIEIGLYKRNQLKAQQHESEGLDLEQVIAEASAELASLGISGLSARIHELQGNNDTQ